MLEMADLVDPERLRQLDLTLHRLPVATLLDRIPKAETATSRVSGSTEPLGSAELQGHVVVVNFWTLTGMYDAPRIGSTAPT